MADGPVLKAQHNQSVVVARGLAEGRAPGEDALDLAEAPASEVDVMDADVQNNTAALLEVRVVGGRELAAGPGEAAAAHGTQHARLAQSAAVQRSLGRGELGEEAHDMGRVKGDAGLLAGGDHALGVGEMAG